jgi:Peptidase family M28/PDZ domain/PA domain
MEIVMKRIAATIFLCFFVLAGRLNGQIKRSTEITVDELRYHLKYLASDELEGRRAGSHGAEMAAAYIENEFHTYGLEPLGDNGTYFQSFEFTSGVKLGDPNDVTLVANGAPSSLRMDTDFRPLGFSATAYFSGGVAFAGYGIAAPDQQYDDYNGLEVNGKAVLILRYHPEGSSQHSGFGQYSGLRYKAAKAKEKGATLVLLVTGPADTDQDGLMKLTYDQSVGDAGIPAISITQATADRMLAPKGVTIKELQETINKEKKPSSFVIPNLTITTHTTVDKIKATSKNVIGLLKGDGPLANEVVVVGAHYDHLGYGGEGSGSLQPDTVAIHNGADDNGSGTVGLLELAQYFAAHRSDLKRSLLFISFSGEEEGLLGSAYYVRNPTIPLDRIVTMVNMDMVGRLTNRKLIVYGIGTSPSFESMIRKDADSLFDLRLNKDGYGPSDQSSFYGAKIPVFHFFTDLHSDYHRPSDTWEKINFEGEREVLGLVRSVVTDLDDLEKRPEYVKVEQERPRGGEEAIRSYTGTIPDFGEQVEGMKLSGVRDGSPAAKAGLQAGDVIVKFGTIDIKNLYDYTFALGEYKPGDEVVVVVKRGNERKSFKLTVGRRN